MKPNQYSHRPSIYKVFHQWGQHSTVDSILASGPSGQGFDSQHARYFSEEKNIDGALVKQWQWLEEKGQWLENVDRTHLVLGSGKPVLPKKNFIKGDMTAIRFLMLKLFLAAVTKNW